MDSESNCLICDNDYISKDGECVKEDCPVNNCVACEIIGSEHTCDLCEKGLVLYTYTKDNMFK